MTRLRSISRSPIFHVALWLLPLAAVIWWATKQQAPKWPDTPGEIAWVVGALLVYAVTTMMRGERWHVILRSSDIPVKRADSQGLTVVGYAGNNVLPARGGELLRVFLLSSRTGAQRRTVLGTILAERMLDALALGGILVVVAYDLVRSLGSPSPGLVLAGAAAVVAVALAAAYAWWRHRHHAERFIDVVKPMLAPIRPLLGFKGLALLAVSVVIWMAEATVYAMVAESVGIRLGLSGALGVVAFTNVAALIPAAPGYVGTYDAAVVFATKRLTGSANNVVAYLIMLRFVIFVPISVVGMALLFLRYGGLERFRAAREAAREEKMLEAPPAPGAAVSAARTAGKPIDSADDAVEATA